MSFVQIGFEIEGQGGAVLGAASITPELAEALRRAGRDPREFNRMRWPHGASRHASGKFLFTSETLFTLSGGQAFDSDLTPVRVFRVGDVRFDRMFARTPRQVVLGIDSVLWELEVVDQRFFWHERLSDDNVRPDDKSKVYASTATGTTPKTFSALVAGCIPLPANATKAPFILASEFDLAALADAPADVNDGLRDLRSNGGSFAEAIDSYCAMAGMVMVAHPEPVAGKRYTFKRLQVGYLDAVDAGAGAFTSQYDDLTAGGMTASGSSSGTQAERGWRQDWGGEMPGSIAVLMPTYLAALDYAYNDVSDTGGKQTWATNQYHSAAVTHSAVRTAFANWWPEQSQAVVDGMSRPVVDSAWVAVNKATGVPTVPATAAARALVVGRVFWSRYLAGCGDTRWRGCIPLTPWAGCLWREWGIDGIGDEAEPYTRAWGDVHDPLFGWNTRAESLRPTDVTGTGLAKVVQRPDGGVQIDVPLAAAPPPTLFAWIDAWVSVPGKVGQYYYGWKEVERVGGVWQLKAGGQSGGPNQIGSGRAVNGAEANNEGNAYESLGVDVTDTDTATVSLNPIGWGLTKPVVQLVKAFTGASAPFDEWTFTAGNEVDVACVEGAATAESSLPLSPLLVNPQPAIIVPALPAAGSSFATSATRVYFVYLGLAMADWTWTKAVVDVKTAGAGTQTAAQVGLCLTEDAPDGAGLTFTISALASLASLLSTGGKAAVPLTEFSVPAGWHVWACIRVAMATTQPRFRGLDLDCGIGAAMSAPAAAALTVGNTYTATVNTAAVSAPWVAVQGESA